MAIAFDASSGSKGVGSTTLTWSHTCTGSNRTLIVACSSKTDDYITGVTYGGVSMTLVDNIVGVSGGDANRLYVLTNPASGANNVVITSSASIDLVGSAASYTGTSSVTPTNKSKGTTTGAGSNALSQNISITISGTNSWLVGGGFCLTSIDYSTLSEGSNLTDRNGQYSGFFSPNGENNTLIFDSNGIITGSPTSTINTNAHSAGKSYYAGQIIIELSPLSTVSSNNFLSLL